MSVEKPPKDPAAGQETADKVWRIDGMSPAAIEAARAAAPSGPLTNKEVAELQGLLQKLSLLKAKPDGMLGPATTAAVRDYQAMAGLRQTGVATRELLAELRDIAGR